MTCQKRWVAQSSCGRLLRVCRGVLEPQNWGSHIIAYLKILLWVGKRQGAMSVARPIIESDVSATGRQPSRQ